MKKPKEFSMNLQKLKAVTAAIPVFLALTFGAGKAAAISVLTFDGAVSQSSTFNALGFSVTSIGAADLATVDFNMYDVVYISQSYQDLLSSPLLPALAGRADDLASYVSSGGGIVFGSPAIGTGPGGIVALDPSNPILNSPNPIDLSGLGLQGLPLPVGGPLNTVAVDGSGNPVLVTGELGSGRLVGWNPDSNQDSPITENGMQLVDNSINWAAGGHPSAVPEPASLALTALGIGGLIFAARRKS
jgi:hypothetical protein